MADERLGLWVQECLLALLAFDDQVAVMLSGGVPLACFEGDFHEIAARLYDYTKRYRVAAGEHVQDLLSDLTDATDDAPRAARYTRTVKTLFDRYGEDINKDLILSKLSIWTRQQLLKGAVINAAQLLQAGTTESLDQAEGIILKATRARIEQFDPGTSLGDLSNLADWIKATRPEDACPTGVDPIDELGMGPIRGGLHLLIAPAKHGKTHWLINLGKRAAVRGLRVVHVTLEMSEARVAQRYIQSIFGLPKRLTEYTVPRLQRDPTTGMIIGLDIETITPQHSLADDQILQVVHKRALAVRRIMSHIRIKGFPTNTLTVTGLDAYLEGLAAATGFVPDLLVVDYADLLQIQTDNDQYRTALGRTYARLRGLAGERGLALATASQSNREAMRAKMVDASNVAEDWSKIATADCVLTYSRTDAERELGMARLLVAAGRDDADRFVVAVTQSYDTAQFVLDSVRMPADYWALLGEDPM